MLCSLVGVVLSGSVSAQLIVPVAQQRSVSGTVNILGPEPGSDSVEDQAPDFTPYAGAESVTLDNGFALSSGGGIQDSQITATSILASGSAYTNSESYESGWSASAHSLSFLSFDFTLTEKASYTLTGEYSAFDHADIVIWLHSDSGTVLSAHTINGPGKFTLDFSGVLEPGDYTFGASAEGSTFGSPFEFDYGFAEYDVDFQLTPLVSSYCLAAPNSAGPGALLSAAGSLDIGDDDFRVEATGAVPGGIGLVFYGPNQVQLPFGDGFRCVGGHVYRVPPTVQADPSGFVSKPISFSSGPAASGPGRIDPDSTWNFQLWYRDTMAPGGSGFNVSDGLSVTFCP